MGKAKVNEQCQNISKRLSAYVDGELSIEDAEQVRRHLEGCPDCQKVYDELQKLWDALDYPVPISAPVDLEARVLVALDKQLAQPSIHTIRKWRFLPASLLAAAIALLIGGWMGTAILDKEAADHTQHSITASLDVFTPAPKGTLIERYFAMVHNPESR